MFGTASYAYDTLDNLLHVQVIGGTQVRDHYYCYDDHNRLDFVRTGPICGSPGSPASPATLTFTYDVQGNLLSKNGAAYAFDYGNRLRTGGGQTYRYDADGRRVRQDNAGAQLKYSQYSKDGRLLWQRDEVAGKRIANVYLAGSLVAEYSRPVATSTVTASYFHTDALGSPIAKTNSSGVVTETSEYEPYGALLNRANDDRAGYTGHVMDAATGLTYVQQRYYDPAIGRFLSVDPVTANSVTGSNFNRYWYVNNNPYKFTDPDGRQTRRVHDGDTDSQREAAIEERERTNSAGAGLSITMHSPGQMQNVRGGQSEHVWTETGAVATGIVNGEIFPTLDENADGTTSCAELLKSTKTFGAAHTSEWREGRKLVPGLEIMIGTAIATFNSRGRYPQGESNVKHAAIFVGFSPNGIYVLDQWNGLSAINYRELQWNADFGNQHSNYVNSASSFSTIEW
ncbi:MAG: hypothetical protein EOP50_03215 [Sphingobacteriales bacterium]|nr:MAG: hypothetical protein EOP50_03215 [Sphingobacteriales bacterium]